MGRRRKKLPEFRPIKALGIPQSELKRILLRPDIQSRISSAFRRKKVISIALPGERGGYRYFIAFRIKPFEYFDPRSFRFIPKRLDPHKTRFLIGCPRGRWKKGRCKAATTTHKILIPITRVMSVIRTYYKKRRRMVANPLLMTIANPRKNPVLMMVQNKCPFSKNRSIPREQFEQWLYKTGRPEEIRRYRDEVRKYRRFHQGSLPVSITRQVLNIGMSKKITDREFSFSAGKSPAEMYSIPGHSKKIRHGKDFIHHYDTPPQGVVMGKVGKQVIVKQLKGKAKVTDWYHH